MKKRLALLSCCLALTMALCGCNGGHVHSFSDSYIEEPTCEEGGTVERVCSECGEIVTEEVPPLGHDWEDGVCMRCGRTESGGMMTLRSITVEGQKTEFTEADAAFTTGDSTASAPVPLTACSAERGRLRTASLSRPGGRHL